MLKHNTTWFKKVYIACGKTDLRLGVDGLATLIQSQFGMNALQEQVLFLFCGIKKDRIKGLLWEGDGFVLLYKRIENGRFQWPRNSQEVKEMTAQEYQQLMSGFSIESTIHKSKAERY